MVDKFTQFLSEKFLYDQTQAMDLLIVSGLKEQLFDMAKVTPSYTNPHLSLLIAFIQDIGCFYFFACWGKIYALLYVPLHNNVIYRSKIKCTR